MVLAASARCSDAVGAIGYAAFIMYGLRTWWIGAVGTTRSSAARRSAARRRGSRRQPSSPPSRRWRCRSGGSRAARRVSSSPPGSRRPIVRRHRVRSGVTQPRISPPRPPSDSWPPLARTPSARLPAFFGAGGLLLVAGSAAFARWLRRSHPESSDGRGVIALRRRLCALAPDAQRAVRVTHRVRLLRHRRGWRVSARPERHIARAGFGNGRLRADGGVGRAAHVQPQHAERPRGLRARRVRRPAGRRDLALPPAPGRRGELPHPLPSEPIRGSSRPRLHS